MKQTEREVRSQHRIAFEDPGAGGDGRVFCTCGWFSPITPEAERLKVLARHINHEVNAQEFCWGDRDKARAQYYEIENGVTV